MSVFLIACLISAASQVGGIEKALMFYDGDCDGGNVSKLNMALHLLINVVSTLVVRIILILLRKSDGYFPLEIHANFALISESYFLLAAFNMK